MNILLIFFAFPIAVIIISIVLQKLLKNPIAVAALIFAIFLIATLAYTILALITALIVKFICQSNHNDNNDICNLLRCVLRNSDACDLLNNISSESNNNNGITSNAVTDILNTNNGNNNNNNSCGCSRYRRYR